MLRQRVMTAVVGVLVLVVIVFLLPPAIALGCYAVAIVFAAWEWSALVRLDGHLARVAYVAAIVTMMALASHYAEAPGIYRQLLLVTAGWWALALIWLVFFPERVSRSAAAIAGALVLVPACKTWEGVAGGVAGAALIAAVGAELFTAPLLAFVLLGIGVALASIVGDLTESMFKRFAGLKDSGNFIPGHGGILDRIDSVTAAVPLFVLGLAVLGESVWSA
jgi:phosphatidate cytidylyltransferase